jgi:hypothetical protein
MSQPIEPHTQEDDSTATFPDEEQAIQIKLRGFLITSQDIEILEHYRLEWRKAKKQRNEIALKAFKDIRALYSGLSKEDTAAKKSGIGCWFHYYGRAKNSRDKFRYGTAWTARTVVGYKYADRLSTKVQDLAGGAVPGSKEFMSHYQRGLTKMIKKLPNEVVEEAGRTAQKWNLQGPPSGLQAK